MISWLLLTVVLCSVLPFSDVRMRLIWILGFAGVYSASFLSLSGVTCAPSLLLVELLAFTVTIASLTLVLQDANVMPSSTSLFLVVAVILWCSIAMPVVRLDHIPQLPVVLASGMSVLSVTALCWSLLSVSDVLFLMVYFMLHLV